MKGRRPQWYGKRPEYACCTCLGLTAERRAKLSLHGYVRKDPGVAFGGGALAQHRYGDLVPVHRGTERVVALGERSPESPVHVSSSTECAVH